MCMPAGNTLTARERERERERDEGEAPMKAPLPRKRKRAPLCARVENRASPEEGRGRLVTRVHLLIYASRAFFNDNGSTVPAIRENRPFRFSLPPPPTPSPTTTPTPPHPPTASFVSTRAPTMFKAVLSRRPLRDAHFAAAKLKGSRCQRPPIHLCRSSIVRGLPHSLALIKYQSDLRDYYRAMRNSA
jgi:hypothetical protein